MKRLLIFCSLFIYFPLHAQTLDNSFALQGINHTSYGTAAFGQAISVQSDGKVITAAINDLLSMRLTSSGWTDPSWGGTGIVNTLPAGTCRGVAQAIKQQADGKIVVAGYSCPNSYQSRRISVARYLDNGTLDTTFGTGGISIFDPGTESLGLAMELTSTRILIAGSFGSTATIAALRISDGQRDLTWGQYGFRKVTIGDSSIFTAMALQADGKIVAAGYASKNFVRRFAIARLTAAGAIDTTFAAGLGYTMIHPAGANAPTGALATGVKLDSSGRIVTTGYAIDSSNSYYRFAAIRLTSSGTLDTSFGIGGATLLKIGDQEAIANASLILGNGSILLGGYSLVGSRRLATFARLNANGLVDTSFGYNGVFLLSSSGDAAIQAMALQPDGKVVATGYDGHDILNLRFY